MNKIYLSSYPASGSHWLGYILSKLFDLNIYEYSKEVKNLFIGTNENVFINKGHISGTIHKECINESDGLILILRNYKECILRRLKQHNSFTLNNLSEDEIISFLINELQNKDFNINDIYGHSIDYIRLLDVYDKFTGKKTLIYYEDLINNNLSEYKKIDLFFRNFDIFGNHIDFLNNIDEHKNNSLLLYKELVPGTDTLTNGNYNLYHSFSLSTDIKKYIDRHIKTNFKKLFDKYLTRYEENN